MGNIKNPDEVKEKNFSDSLELFDSLFQEELESGTKEQGPSKRPSAGKTPDKENKKVSGVGREAESDGLESSPSAKKVRSTTKTPGGRKGEGAGPKTVRPGPNRKSVPKKKAPSDGEYDTLKLRTKDVHPNLEPGRSGDEPGQKAGLAPLGIIRMGKKEVEDPLPGNVSPEKVGKLYTPKETKSLIPALSIKESNLYKVVLSGFAAAIIVMVLINFFGLIGAGESKDPSTPIKKKAVQKASLKKSKNFQALNTPKKSPTKNSEGQKKFSRPASSPRLNKIAKKSNIKTQPPRKAPAVPVSPPQPDTTRPQESPPVPAPSSQTNSVNEITAPQKSPPQPTPASPVSSTETSTGVIGKALKKPDVRKRPPGPAVVTPPETTLIGAPAKPPSPPKSQRIADRRADSPKGKGPSYPYSVYLGAYKTLESAKAAVSSYQEQGLYSHWVKVDLGRKGTWFRLFTGHFRDEDAAQDFIDERYLKEASVKKTRYSTLIGVYSTKDVIKRKSLALQKLGYGSYIVDGVNGTSRLYSGAFYTKTGAEKQQKELVAKGIQSRVVER